MSERPHAAPRATIVVFARAPEAGRVKTRLAASIGPGPALQVYRTLAERVVRALREVEGAQLVVRCTPDDRAADVLSWLGSDLRVEPQGDGDLGERMERAVAAHLRADGASVIVVGTDAPDLDATVIEAALTRLATHDLVFGPALDGGYFLVGMRQLAPEVFRDIPWSAPDTLDVSLAHAAAAGRRVALLDPLLDIDTVDDWRTWQSKTWRGDQRARGV